MSYRKFKEDKCELCGNKDKEVLCVHHKNCYREDNRKENLQTLCANCHRKVHAEIRKLIPVVKKEGNTIEKIYPKALDEETIMFLLLLLGYRKGNGLIHDERGNCIGFRCRKDDLNRIEKQKGQQ